MIPVCSGKKQLERTKWGSGSVKVVARERKRRINLRLRSLGGML